MSLQRAGRRCAGALAHALVGPRRTAVWRWRTAGPRAAALTFSSGPALEQPDKVPVDTPWMSDAEAPPDAPALSDAGALPDVSTVAAPAAKAARPPKALMSAADQARKLFIANFPLDMTDAELVHAVASVTSSPVEACTIPRDAAGRGRGYGFVVLESAAAAADAARELDGAWLGGRELRVRPADPPKPKAPPPPRTDGDANALHACRDVAAVLGVWYSRGADLCGADVVLAMARTAALYKEATRFQSPQDRKTDRARDAFAAMAQRAFESLRLHGAVASADRAADAVVDAWDGRTVARLFYALATVDPMVMAKLPAAQLIGGVDVAVAAVVPSLQPDDAAWVACGCAKVRVGNEARLTLTATFAAALQHVNALGPHALVNACWAFATDATLHHGNAGRAAVDVAPLFQKAALRLPGMKLAPPDLARVIWAYGAKKARQPALFDDLAQRATADVSRFRPGELADIAEALSRVPDHPAFSACFSAISQRTAAEASKMPPNALLKIAWASARRGIPDAPLFASVSPELARGMPRLVLPPKLVSSLAWTFSVDVGAHSELFAALALRALPRMADFQAYELANLLWSFSRARCLDQELFRGVSTEFLRANKLQKLKATTVANLVSSYAIAGARPAELLRAAAPLIIAGVDELAPKHAAKVALAYATLQAGDAGDAIAAHGVVSAVARRYVAAPQLYQTQQLAQVVLACAASGCANTDVLDAALGEARKAVLRHLSASVLHLLRQCSVLLAVQAPGHGLTHVLNDNHATLEENYAAEELRLRPEAHAGLETLGAALDRRGADRAAVRFHGNGSFFLDVDIGVVLVGGNAPRVLDGLARAAVRAAEASGGRMLQVTCFDWRVLESDEARDAFLEQLFTETPPAEAPTSVAAETPPAETPPSPTPAETPPTPMPEDVPPTAAAVDTPSTATAEDTPPTAAPEDTPPTPALEDLPPTSPLPGALH
ncbi:hypothetical protein M885DRAFT_534978 [Pelagophyceae sp. CCMP2097]|nr:hypothetical protein M885DRAFT_534978 [Pelagophyceae sp. CCMP2097]